ncbi:MAG TPA: LptF/LptG family permease [Candidatus Ornithospirochaeta avicola]|uniref:LptF/LptG family permease n=1 Tax=Candidatus Ornithospirochaeta avicola TaxID=2840896 RepID=A0A9D1PTD6_9SPIO|nr:LptF/LptG family permease [Candidatus Ornithospirochaeta avicola]
MRIIWRYSIFSILKVAAITLLIFSLLVMAVETFMRMDSIINAGYSFLTLFYSSFFSLSDYFIMLLSLALLFSTTYFYSTLSANNERLALYSSGYSKKCLTLPVIMLAILISIFLSFLNETVILNWKSEARKINESLFGLEGTSSANTITLFDEKTGYIVYSPRYSESTKHLYSPIIIKTEENRISERVEADYALYENGTWIFIDGSRVRNEEIFEFEETILPDFSFSEDLFLEGRIDASLMSFSSSIDYLKRVKAVNESQYNRFLYEFLHRIAEPFTVFILMMIAILMNYSYKKNVLLFSLFESIVIALVYFVSDMVFSILASEEIVNAALAITFPSLATIIIALVISEAGRKL